MTAACTSSSSHLTWSCVWLLVSSASYPRCKNPSHALDFFRYCHSILLPSIKKISIITVIWNIETVLRLHHFIFFMTSWEIVIPGRPLWSPCTPCTWPGLPWPMHLTTNVSQTGALSSMATVLQMLLLWVYVIIVSSLKSFVDKLCLPLSLLPSSEIEC